MIKKNANSCSLQCWIRGTCHLIIHQLGLCSYNCFRVYYNSQSDAHPVTVSLLSGENVQILTVTYNKPRLCAARMFYITWFKSFENKSFIAVQNRSLFYNRPTVFTQ